MTTEPRPPLGSREYAPVLGYSHGYLRELLRTAAGRESLPVRPYRRLPRGHWKWNRDEVERFHGSAL